ncbi:MAG: outer membrane protein transport protein, partial [Holophagae bacterium]|nr:outer membrane protein transport protein [Holophagae bacterium]
MKKLIAVCVGLLATMLAFPAGFQVNEQNASGAAMGNAYVASVDNASAMFYNPGALAFVNGIDVNMGSTLFFPAGSWTSLDGSMSTDQKTKINFIPAVFVSYQLNDRVVVGISQFTQYGLETDWPTEWPGSQLSDRTKIRTFNVTPTIAFKVTDNFSMGFQVNWVGADVLIQKTINFVDQTAWTDLSGDGDGWGASAGFLWKVNDQVKVGGFWRSAVDVKFEGEADFDNVPTPFLPVLYDGEITAGVKLPQTWGLDVAYQVNDKLMVEVGFMNTQWSTYSVLAVYRKDTGGLLS